MDVKRSLKKIVKALDLWFERPYLVTLFISYAVAYSLYYATVIVLKQLTDPLKSLINRLKKD